MSQQEITRLITSGEQWTYRGYSPEALDALIDGHHNRQHTSQQDEATSRPGIGTGMPTSLYLDEFGSQIWAAFGHPPYHVGSSLTKKTGWRDVDVRLILNDEEYERLGLGDPVRTHHNAKWVSLVLAYSALGKAMTGLPIDFQIQQQTYANETFKGVRSALGMTPLRLARYEK